MVHNATAGLESGDVDSDGYSYHTEPAEQGGERYVKCGHCGAELFVRLGGKDAMIHRTGCPRGEWR